MEPLTRVKISIQNQYKSLEENILEPVLPFVLAKKIKSKNLEERGM